MKIKYIANAFCEYKYKGYKIISDPWLTPGAFEGSWIHNPPLQSKPEDFHDVDAIYLSHIHPDHFDETFLKTLRKTIPIIILDLPFNILKKKLLFLGFKNIQELLSNETRSFGPFEITMQGPFTDHLFHETRIGNLIDSAIILQAGRFTILNGNDNAPSGEAAEMLHHKFGDFDLVQLVDSCAGPYPACFSNLSHEEKLSERDRILKRHLDVMIECAKILGAKHIQPFAGHYKLQGPLAKLNQYLGVLEPAEVHKRYLEAGLNSILLYEGDEFVLVR